MSDSHDRGVFRPNDVPAEERSSDAPVSNLRLFRRPGHRERAVLRRISVADLARVAALVEEYGVDER